MRRAAAAALAAALCLWASGRAVAAEPAGVRVSGSASGLRVLERVAGAFNRIEQPDAPVRVSAGGNFEGLEQFLAGKIDVLAWSGPLGVRTRARLAGAFGEGAVEPGVHPLGRFAVAVVVNRSNPVKSLTLEQFSGIYGGRLTRWHEVEPGLLGGAEIAAYCPPRGSNTNHVAQMRGLGGRSLGLRVRSVHDTAELVRAVADNAGAVGILLYGEGMALEQVKVVALRERTEPLGLVPTCESLFESGYPLAEELTLLVRPGAPEEAGRFCRFACGRDGWGAVRESGAAFFHVYEQKKLESARRLRELAERPGEGERVLASACRDAAGLLDALNVEFVTEALLVRVDSLAGPQVSTVGGLVSGRELAVVEGVLTPETLRAHDERFKQLAPARKAMGARGTAIIVHSLNNLDSLTLEQVRAVFGGGLNDWRLLEASQSNLAIRRYGPGKYDPAANIFYEKVLPWAECRSVIRKDTPAEIIAAVGADAQGIAFVSLTDVMDHMRKLQDQLREAVRSGNAAMLASFERDATGRPVITPSIKVLAIGPKESPVAPDRTTVNDGSYPLSSPLTVYISPNAREPARKFAEFCVTRQIHPVLLRHGIVPSFTAEEQDRQVAAAKRAAEEEARLAAERARWEALFTERVVSDDFRSGAGEWDDTSGFARVELGEDRFALQAEAGKAEARSVHRRPLPGAFQLDVEVQVQFGRPSGRNAFVLHFGRRPAISGRRFDWGTGYALAVVDDAANDGLRLTRPELDERGRVVRPSVQVGQKVTAVDDRPHRVRIISEGDGRIHVFYDDMSRPAISIDDGEQFQGGDGTFLGISAGAGVGARVTAVTVKTKKAAP